MAYIQCELPEKNWSKVNIKFFGNSKSKKYLVTPDAVGNDKKKMSMPVYGLILGVTT